MYLIYFYIKQHLHVNFYKKPANTTLGKYSDALPVEKARKMAQVLIGHIVDGD
jgi:hypothetical protein